MEQELSTPPAAEAAPKPVKVIAIIMLIVGLLIGIGILLAFISGGITIYSVYGLVTASGLVATFFGIRKLKNWGFYLFTILTVASILYDIYLVISGKQTSVSGIFVYQLVNIAVIFYLWQAYKKNRLWLAGIAVIFLLSLVIVIYPKKSIPNPKVASLIKNQMAQKPTAAQTTKPINFKNDQLGYSVTFPAYCRKLVYIKIDALKDPDVFACYKGTDAFQIAFEGTGGAPSDLDNYFQNLKQIASGNGMQISEDRDYSYDAGNGQTIDGKQMKETYDLGNSHMKQWLILLPSNNKNSVLEFMYTANYESYDVHKQDALDILNSWKLN
ncbi:MAG: hypothetical protein P4L62_03455 [Candidatus Pacebacteria bacterium]|nr:hypothetical protein [Candidatus Paceibacterota bacterium]